MGCMLACWLTPAAIDRIRPTFSREQHHMAELWRRLLFQRPILLAHYSSWLSLSLPACLPAVLVQSKISDGQSFGRSSTSSHKSIKAQTDG
ncbi:unnamed protein product [Musa hybrid cultivar]